MFEHLAPKGPIIVVGPQRSGSRACAKMIAHDTYREYVDEKDVYTHSRRAAREHLRERIVLQAPGLTYCVHRLAQHIDDLFVVMMIRDIDDIIRSQDRIGWRSEAQELCRYGLRPDEGPISAVKYNVWEEQKEHIKHYLEVEYDSLKAHDLWVGDRAGFEWDQTE